MMLCKVRGTHPSVWVKDEVSRFFDDVFDIFPNSETRMPFGRGAFPVVNMWEDEEALYAQAELPGLSLDDIEVHVHDNQLTIKGERKCDETTENVTYHRRECGVGSFSRVLRLPVEVDADKAGAQLRDGVLTVSLPKAEAVTPRKIKVSG